MDDGFSVGDGITIDGSTTDNNGEYYILSISDDVIYLTTDTQFTTETSSDLVITTDSVRTISNSPELTFAYDDSSEKNTIVRDSGSWKRRRLLGGRVDHHFGHGEQRR